MDHRYLTLTLALVPALTQGGGVFWSDRGASQLKRMNFDGSSLQTIALSGAVTSPGTNVRGIGLDNVNNRIFWADNGADRLLRANFDGSSSVILHTITGGGSFPADVTVDIGNQLVYWCDQQRRRIQRSTPDGLSVTDLITNAAPTGPYFMDLNLADGKIYWGSFGDEGEIYRAGLDGSGKEALLSGNNRTRGVGVDPAGGMLYWVNRNDKKVHRCPLSAFAGGPIPLTHPAVQTLYANLDTPHGLVMDIPARKLYWADTGTNPGGGNGGQAVSRGDFDGSTPMEILATGIQPWDVDLDRRCYSYAEWRWRCFRRDALPEQTNLDADPEGDGLKNALEYAFDLAPLHVDSASLVEALLIDGPVANERYPALKYTRRAGTADLTYSVQVATNLFDWEGSLAEPQTTETVVTPLADGMEEVTVRALNSLSSHPILFMRVTIQVDP